MSPWSTIMSELELDTSFNSCACVLLDTLSTRLYAGVSFLLAMVVQMSSDAELCTVVHAISRTVSCPDLKSTTETLSTDAVGAACASTALVIVAGVAACAGCAATTVSGSAALATTAPSTRAALRAATAFMLWAPVLAPTVLAPAMTGLPLATLWAPAPAAVVTAAALRAATASMLWAPLRAATASALVTL